MYKRFWRGLVTCSIGLFLFFNVAKADTIPGSGEVDGFLLMNYKIVNVEDAPDTVSAQNSIVFKEGGTNNELTQPTYALQYIEVSVASNYDNARVLLYVDNKGGSDPKEIGPRLEKDTGYTYYQNELDYFENNHPYKFATQESADLKAGYKPSSFETGLIGDKFPDTEEIKTVTPIFWGVYENWQDPNSSSSLWAWAKYDYADPYDPKTTGNNQFRGPGDWWASSMEKYRWDWDWKPDSDNPGHFDVDYVNGDPYNNFWLSIEGYRTVATLKTDECNLGHYPGLREINSTDPDYGKRLDEDGNPISYDGNGEPATTDNWGVRLDTLEVQPIGADEDGNPIYGYKIYLYLGANLTDKFAQEYSSARLMLTLVDDDSATDDIVYAIPISCEYNEVKKIATVIKAKNTGEYTDGLYFCENNPATSQCNPNGVDRGVMARQYVEVASLTNAYNGRVMAYIDNTHDQANPKYTGRRTTDDTNYAPYEGAEEDYRHSTVLDANTGHSSLPTAEKNAVDAVSGDYNALNPTLKPASFVRGLVKESNPEITIPIFWQAYDDPKSPYPVYNNENPWNPDPFQIGWSHIHDPYSFEWDWQLEYVDDKPTGHFRVYTSSDLEWDAVDPATGWMPMKYDRTVIQHTPVDKDFYGDVDGWLGNYPGEGNTGTGRSDINGDGFLALTGKSPVYLYFATNYDGASAGTYKTNRIIIDFE